MNHSSLRFARSGTAAGSLLILVCRVALATDIDSPAYLNAAYFPNLTFNQTGGGAIPTYQWGILANESSYFVKDVSAQTYPFTIVSGAVNDLMYLSGSNVGIGTSTPTAGLHLKKAAQSSTAEILARFETTDDPIGGLFITNSSASDGLFIPKITGRSATRNAALISEAIISQDQGASPAIAYNAFKGAGGALTKRPLVVYRNNNVAKVTIAANGGVTATSFNPVSSRILKHDIVELDSNKASGALRQLTPVEFVYNDDESNEKRVGFIAEDVPEIVANKDRKSVPIMDVVALLTKVVKDQQQTIVEQRIEFKDEMESMQKRMDVLERRLARVK